VGSKFFLVFHMTWSTTASLRASAQGRSALAERTLREPTAGADMTPNAAKPRASCASFVKQPFSR
jgi:hypothetical protein